MNSSPCARLPSRALRVVGDPQAEPADLPELLDQVVREAKSQDILHIGELDAVEQARARGDRTALDFRLRCRNRHRLGAAGIADQRDGLLESVGYERGEARGAFIVD